ncbi:MAG: methyltransferase domain-containing protein [Deltaproteobacteria bacterium]|nr:methyltransferase domain-containing protein [Deltaproteobacteria bacterium]
MTSKDHRKQKPTGRGRKSPQRKDGPGRPGSPGATRQTRQPEQVRLLVARALLDFLAGNEFDSQPPDALSEEKDRRLFVNLLRGVVRHWRFLQGEVFRLSGRKADRLDQTLGLLACLGLYQIRFMRLPDHAAVNETVELAPTLGRHHGKGWLNGVLRAAAREGLRETDSPEKLSLAMRTSHPDWMVERWQKRFGETLTGELCENNNRFSGAGVRVETGRISPEKLLEWLDDESVQAEMHPLLHGSLWVENTAALLASQAFERGLCYVQDVSSQLLVSWITPLLSGMVLDVCCAPGGKLTQLAGQLGGKARLTALDISSHRLERVRENILRLGLTGVRLLQADGRRLPFVRGENLPEVRLRRGWDAVVLDAPCSATGTIRKYPEMKLRKLPGDLPRLADSQQALLAEAARVVRPGGLVCYITCSLEREENQDVVDTFLEAHPGWRRLSFGDIPTPEGLAEDPRGFITDGGDFFILPGKNWMGMYGACLQRGED